MARVIVDPALALDQIGDPPCRPQARVVAERFRATLEPALDPLKIGVAQSRLASRPAGFLQRRPPPALELLRPTADRLAMDTDLSRDLRLRDALPQESRGVQSSLFQRIEIPSHPGWISHASNGST